MNNNQINQEQFSLMLENYRNSLLEMNTVTEAEIKRVEGIKVEGINKEAHPPKAAVEFINKQLFSCLDNLAALAGTIPDYTVHGCFTKEECGQLQQRALDKLKQLGYASA